MQAQNIFPSAADFIVTKECNLHCPVCWGSHMPPFARLPIEMQESMLEVLAKNGVKAMSITGGEPLTEPNLPKLLKKANSDLGLKLILFTNCTLLQGKEKNILPYISRISVSLDGYNEPTNSYARKQGHFDTVIDTFKLMRNKYPKKQTQAITVVTEKNKDFLEKIGERLVRESEGLDFCWKLNYYFLIGRENPSFQLPYNEFEDRAKDMKNRFSDMFQVRYSQEDRDYAYFFVFPDAGIYTTKGSEYIPLGNLLIPDSYDEKSLGKIKLKSLDRRKEEKKIK